MKTNRVPDLLAYALVGVMMLSTARAETFKSAERSLNWKNPNSKTKS